MCGSQLGLESPSLLLRGSAICCRVNSKPISTSDTLLREATTVKCDTRRVDKSVTINNSKNRNTKHTIRKRNLTTKLRACTNSAYQALFGLVARLIQVLLNYILIFTIIIISHFFFISGSDNLFSSESTKKKSSLHVCVIPE